MNGTSRLGDGPSGAIRKVPNPDNILNRVAVELERDLRTGSKR